MSVVHATVIIRMETGAESVYRIRVEQGADRDGSAKVLRVLASAVEMGCALLDAEYLLEPSGKDSPGGSE